RCRTRPPRRPRASSSWQASGATSWRSGAAPWRWLRLWSGSRAALRRSLRSRAESGSAQPWSWGSSWRSSGRRSRARSEASGAGGAILAGGVFGLMFVMYGQTDPLEPFTAVTIGRFCALAVLVPIVLQRGPVSVSRPDLWRLSAVGAVDAVAFGAFVAAVD